MDELARQTCHVCGAVSQYGLGWCTHHGQGGLQRLCQDCECPECYEEVKDKPPRTAKDSLVAMGVLAIQLLRWIASDGQLRTDDQIVDEMVAVLGFSRRGVRIERAIQSAITLWRKRA